MPAKNPRISTVVDRGLLKWLRSRARREGISVSLVVRDLLMRVREDEEERYWAAAARSAWRASRGTRRCGTTTSGAEGVDVSRALPPMVVSRDLPRLDPPTRLRIRTAIERKLTTRPEASQSPRAHDPAALVAQGRRLEGHLRLRDDEIWVLRIGHRREVYADRAFREPPLTTPSRGPEPPAVRPPPSDARLTPAFAARSEPAKVPALEPVGTRSPSERLDSARPNTRESDRLDRPYTQPNSSTRRSAPTG